MIWYAAFTGTIALMITIYLDEKKFSGGGTFLLGYCLGAFVVAGLVILFGEP